VKVKAYCGHYLGPPYWHGTEIYEPAECAWEGAMEVDVDEWIEGYASAVCPTCGAMLWQSDCHLESMPGTVIGDSTEKVTYV